MGARGPPRGLSRVLNVLKIGGNEQNSFFFMSSILTHQTSASSVGEGYRWVTMDWDLQGPPTRTLGALKNNPIIGKKIEKRFSIF